MPLVGCIVATKDLAQALFWWAGAIAFVIGTIGGVAAWIKYWRDLKAREWDRAHQAYERFLGVAIDNPEFIPGYWSDPAQTPAVRNKYRWFMARFLWAAEQVLKTVPEKRQEWEWVLLVMLCEHRDYLCAPENAEEVQCYYGRLGCLIEEVCSAPSPTR